MVLGDVSGVCFTFDPVTGNRDHMVIEAVPGGNEALTDGSVVPVRYLVDRRTGQLESESATRQWSGLLDARRIASMVETFQRVEAICGGPQDIEWTVKQGELWVLQARPITGVGGAPALSALEARDIPAVPRDRDITSIYRAYRVPPNLRLHLLRVAAVATVISDAWRGPTLDRGTIILTSLLHDIGNIVKADFDRFPALFPEELRNLPYWRAVQDQIRTRYGSTDQEVSLKIASELGVSERIRDLLQRKLFIRNAETLASEDWELKICAYSDQRVGPYGVLPLVERLREAKERYRGVPYASVNTPGFEHLVDCAILIEQQLQQFVDRPLGGITESLVEDRIEGLRHYLLPSSSDVAR
jgi:hypothetical protein